MAGGKRPAWLEVETVLGELGYADRADDRRRYLKRMKERAWEGTEAGGEREHLSGGGLWEAKPSETQRPAAGDAAALPKGDWRKRSIGHVVKKETSVTLTWIGRRLRRGSQAYVSRMCSHLGELAGRRDVRRLLEQLELTSEE